VKVACGATSGAVVSASRHTVRSAERHDPQFTLSCCVTLPDALVHLEIEDREVTAPLVKSAYRRLIQKWHPDKHAGTVEIENATRKAQNLNHAYEVLSVYFQAHLRYVQPVRSTPDKTERTWQPPPRPTKASSPISGRRFWKNLVEHGFPDERVFEVFFFSSHLVSAGYNALERILYQKFHHGSGSTVVYRYHDVPQSIWDGLLAAPSHGRFAIRHINHSFRYELCTEPNRPYNPAWRLD